MQQTDIHSDTANKRRGVSNSWVVPLGCCTGVSCGPPLHVANGVVRGAVFQFGDVAVYSCFGGYVMEGVGRSRCLENGTWTPPPTCRGRESTPLRLPAGTLPASSDCPLCTRPPHRTAPAHPQQIKFPLEVIEASVAALSVL